VDWDGNPSPRRLSDFRRFDTEEAGYRGASEIDIEDSDGVAGERE